jgi:resuscitation-promoting factor RpfA
MPVRLLRAPLLALVTALASVLLLNPTASAADRHATRWDCLAHYESGHRWALDTGNGYYGGLQFSPGTWRYYGGLHYSGNAYPDHATRREQIVIARRAAWRGWLDRRPQGGRNAWPSTWGRCF